MKRTLPGNNLSDEENSNKKPDKSLWRIIRIILLTILVISIIICILYFLMV